jgi:methionine biosynthesis protein MetW
MLWTMQGNKDIVYQWITDHTESASRVLDIGCGDGSLLAQLATQQGIHGSGIELSDTLVMKAVQRGLSVHHGNVEEGLDHYGDKVFDLVILSEIIQEISHLRHVLTESFRVGRRVIVVFPNFGYLPCRWQLAVQGRAPRTASLPYDWSESPNKHFFTVADWEVFCKQQGWTCHDRGFVRSGRTIHLWPNLIAQQAMYLLSDD